MAVNCLFAMLEDECGCHIGYQLPLMDEEGDGIFNYPVTVLNVNGDELAEAASPSEYVSIWNSDTENQAFGVLSIGKGAYCFNLSRIVGVTPPSNVLGFYEEPVPVEGDLRYGYIDLDTTGTPPVEQDYIDGIATAPVDITTTMVLGAAEVNIADFTNPTDKVMFIIPPVSEAAFTMWSVVSDPLQKNESVDQVFAGSEVWFKTGNMYFTRIQTSFGNTLKLHRTPIA